MKSKTRTRVIAALVGFGLVLGGLFAVAPAVVPEAPVASASAQSNYVAVNGTRTLCFLVTGVSYNYCISPGRGIHNVDKLIIPAGRCVAVSWTLVSQCASSGLARWLPLPGGWISVRAQW